MGASNHNSKKGPIAQINVTPFVDVTLVLLVIFMVTAPAILKDVIGVKLPKAQSGSKNQEQTLAVAINRNGNILLNGKLVSEGELAEAVELSMQQTPQIQAIIAADEQSQHKDVVRAIDILKTQGLQRFALQVKRQQRN